MHNSPTLKCIYTKFVSMNLYIDHPAQVSLKLPLYKKQVKSFNDAKPWPCRLHKLLIDGYTLGNECKYTKLVCHFSEIKNILQ